VIFFLSTSLSTSTSKSPLPQRKALSLLFLFSIEFNKKDARDLSLSLSFVGFDPLKNQIS